MRAGRLAWLGHWLYELDGINRDKKFKEYIFSKYHKSNAQVLYCYAVKYAKLLRNPQEIDLIKDTIKNNVIKSLIALSRYIGKYNEFKSVLKDYGITLKAQNGLQSFLRLFNATNNTKVLDEWIKQVTPILNENELLFLRFTKITGVRTSEAINSFNLIIKLYKEGNLEEYYNESWNVLMHFKDPKTFIRGTKNVYISFVPKPLIEEITNSETVTYAQIKKRLQRHNIPLKINLFRDAFGTCLLQHGILEAEINLCQGRISVDIFIRHYWSPKLKKLGNRIIKILEK